MYEASVRPGYPLIAISSPVITPFIFWFFFFFTLKFVQKDNFKLADFIFISLGVIFILATSRRVLFLSFFICVLIIIVLVKALSRELRATIKSRIRNTIGMLSILVIVLFSWLASIGLINEHTLSEFLSKTSDKSDNARTEQVASLIEGWQENPLFGAGPGVDAGISRSEIPGMYEMSYIAKLFETGLIGFSIYILLWGTLFYWTIKCIRRSSIPVQYILATLSGMTIFMLSNATNPYLLAFDYMWFMYVPFVIINYTFPGYKLSNGKN